MTKVCKSFDVISGNVILYSMLKSCFQPGNLEAGCDEAGRGCLAGPVTAAAVILPQDYKHEEINDSKQLTRKLREKLCKEIEAVAICWAVSHATVEEIDKMNILNASYLAMHRAIGKLKPKPDLLLIDGNRFNPYSGIDHKCIIKGDGKFLSIAAASVLAKFYRDELMASLSRSFPGYIWEKNVGYPTKGHRKGIFENGITKHHRRSFQLLPSQLHLFEPNLAF